MADTAGPARRRDRLRASLRDAGRSALWVTHVTNVRYLTGFTGSNGQVLVTIDPGCDVFVTDGRYESQAASELPDLDRVIERANPTGIALERVGEAGLDDIGFEGDHVPFRAGQRLLAAGRDAGVHAESTTGLVEALRAVKDPGEIALLRQACALTDAVFEELVDRLEPGDTERGVARFLERCLVDAGADGPAFDSIVAFGENSARPHHRPTDRSLEPGDVVKVDFGARYRGYHADMTRTVSVGEPPSRLREVHEVVRKAQRRAVACVTAGVEARAVDRACREPIRDAGYGEAFLHATGHGVGLEVHEAPRIATDRADTLAAGMTVTVEPGIYLAGLGGVRIEDTVVVVDGEPADVLTTTSRDLLVL